jgi:ABC-2 type transport system ATP-binding protein
MVTTHGLVKTYGATEALRGIDLDIPAGATYGLIGANGSGKTTALGILAGLRRPSAGEVRLGGSVAYCPDAPEFEPWLTASETLQAAAGLLGRAPGDVGALLARVGLADVAGRRVGGFSRGMKARLGLAAGLVGEPEILLADEPAAALDPAGRVEIVDLLASLEMTVIVSSHDLGDVERICDRIGVLDRGELVYQGDVGSLLARASAGLRVVVRPPAGELLAALRAAAWVRAAREDEPGELTIDVEDFDAAERELAVLLVGSRLVEVAPARVSLQDVFFELTR